MTRHLYEFFAFMLLSASIYFFSTCINTLSQRDYVSAGITTIIGMLCLFGGKDFAALALVQDDS